MIRILCVTEASFLNTGYAVYFKQLIQELVKNPNYDVAEFACYAAPTDPKIYEVPWKLFCNSPDPNNAAEVEQYESSKQNAFGIWKFESVCLEFKPHIVLSIRDYWMDAFIDSSPYRRYFKWIWMPTVDAYPQNEQWVDMYNRCDAILTYNDWSGSVLLHQSNNKIKWAGSAPPIADVAYKPKDKAAIKKSLGFDENSKIIGTVMRNQKRKLFPDLFMAFRKYLDMTGDNNTYLYCHTSYPDGGWDIPHYLKEHNICNKTLFTYVCEKCGQVFPSFFHDAVTFCPKCAQPSATMAHVHNGATPDVLADIYNLFDIYVQYANSEGFGIPLVEAAACGTPIMAINYSAMSDILVKLDGIPVNVLTLITELETGCMRAAPDNDDCADKFRQLLDLTPEQRQAIGERTRQLWIENYSLDKTVSQWVKCIELVNPDENSWESPPRIHEPKTNPPANMNNKEFVRWLLVNVLGEPERLNSYMELRMTRDLNFSVSIGSMYGMYFNENTIFFDRPEHHKFTHEDAYNQMRMLCERSNYWEKARCGI